MADIRCEQMNKTSSIDRWWQENSHIARPEMLGWKARYPLKAPLHKQDGPRTVLLFRTMSLKSNWYSLPADLRIRMVTILMVLAALVTMGAWLYIG